MGLDGGLAHEQRRADLGVGPAPPDLDQHLALSSVSARSSRAAARVRRSSRSSAAKCAISRRVTDGDSIDSPAGDHPHRADELQRRGVLEQEPGGSRLEGAEHVVVEVERGEHDDRRRLRRARRIAVVAASPSRRGMRMSISTTSGLAPPHRVDGVGAVVGLADHGRGRRPTRGSSAARRGRAPRRRRSAPGSRRRTRRRSVAAGRATAATPRSRQPPSAVGPASSVPPRRRPARAGRAARRPIRAAARRSTTGRSVDDLDGHPASRVTGDAHRGRRTAGVLVHVGQPFLDDPVGACGRPRRAARATVIVSSAWTPAARDAATTRSMSAARGGGARSSSPREPPERSTPSTSRRSSIASWAVARIERGGLLDPCRTGRRIDLEGAGVQRDQRHLVGQHVVHLPGDAGPLGEPGLLGAQLTFLFGPLGALTQRVDQVPAGPDVRTGQRDERRDRRRRRRSPPPSRGRHRDA